MKKCEIWGPISLLLNPWEWVRSSEKKRYLERPLTTPRTPDWKTGITFYFWRLGNPKFSEISGKSGNFDRNYHFWTLFGAKSGISGHFRDLILDFPFICQNYHFFSDFRKKWHFPIPRLSGSEIFRIWVPPDFSWGFLTCSHEVFPHVFSHVILTGFRDGLV